MASEWITETLNDVCTTITDGAHFSPKEVLSGCPMASVKDLTRYGIELKGCKRISLQDFDLLKKQGCQPIDGDVLIAKDGNSALDTVCVYTESEDIVLLSSIAILRPNGKVLSNFLRYYLDSPSTRALLKSGFRSGSAIPRVVLKDFKRAPIRYPSLPEQRAIAHILGTLDDKIELNRQMNETLESMARAIFKSWFVDFDPVRAKAEGRDTGLPEEIAELFPDSFEETELGEVPKGWEIATLDKHFEAVKGVSYKGSGLSDEGMPLHNLNSVYESGGYKYEGIKYYNGDFAERHIVKPGDLIVTNTEQGHDRLLIGYAAIVPSIFGDKGIASHHIYKMRTRQKSSLKITYLCYLLNSPQMHDIVSGYANGTTVNMLPIDGVQRPLIVVPPAELVDAFDRIAAKIESRKGEIITENSTLAELRDALLPKLISGELRIKDAGEIIGNVPVE